MLIVVPNPGELSMMIVPVNNSTRSIIGISP